MWNIQMHRNPAKHWRLSLVQVRNFYYLLDFQVFRHEERERDTISTMLTVPSDPTTRGASHRPNLLCLGSNLNCFFKNHLKSSAWHHSHPQSHFLPGVFIMDICDCHILPAWAWTPMLNVCPYLCTKPNSSKPN